MQQTPQRMFGWNVLTDQDTVFRYAIERPAMSVISAHHGQGMSDILNVNFVGARIDRPELSAGIGLHPIAFTVSHYAAIGCVNHPRTLSVIAIMSCLDCVAPVAVTMSIPVAW